MTTLKPIRLPRMTPFRTKLKTMSDYKPVGNLELKAIALKDRHKPLDVKSLEPGKCVVFINKKHNALKMFASGNETVAYLRLPPGQSIEPRAIAMLPKFFNGRSIDYSKALKKVLDDKLGPDYLD